MFPVQFDSILNFNDGISTYENIYHSAGYHPRPLSQNPSRREVQNRLDRIKEVKKETHDTQKMQKLNRLKNYLLEAKEEIQNVQ